MLDFDPESVGDITHTDHSEAINGSDDYLSSTRQRLLRLLKKSKSQSLQYFDQLPILGFNSGFYDTNLIKVYLLKSLQRPFPLTPIKFIERCSRFLLLATPNLRFVDCRLSVDAGNSLHSFSKTYRSKVNKF